MRLFEDSPLAVPNPRVEHLLLALDKAYDVANKMQRTTIQELQAILDLHVTARESGKASASIHTAIEKVRIFFRDTGFDPSAHLLIGDVSTDDIDDAYDQQQFYIHHDTTAPHLHIAEGTNVPVDPVHAPHPHGNLVTKDAAVA